MEQENGEVHEEGNHQEEREDLEKMDSWEKEQTVRKEVVKRVCERNRGKTSTFDLIDHTR